MRAVAALLSAALFAAPAAHAEGGNGSEAASAAAPCLGIGVAPADPDFQQCHRGGTREYRFSVPGTLAAQPDVLAKVNRVNRELVDGVEQWLGPDAGKGDFSAAPLLSLNIDWRVTGINDHLASLVAMTDMTVRPGAPDRNAMAMVVDRRDGRMLTDITAIFTDGLKDEHYIYCAYLDIQRVANALNADPEAGGKGKPPIVDDAGRYRGQWACPGFGELAIGLSGRPGQPFHRLRLIAPPGTAGPEHEGYFDVDLPITPELLEQVRPEYRAAFRAVSMCDDPRETHCRWEVGRP